MFSRWMVGTPESSALTPKGPAINVLVLNGGRYRISGTTSQGARR
jgi:hypothetical protein